jgi:hypothetical protein
MADLLDPGLVQGVLAGVAVVFVLLLARLALLLGATPVGGLTEEILYLRSDLFRPLVRVTLLFLLAECAQFVVPVLTAAGTLRADLAAQALLLIDLFQALLLLLLGAGLLMAFRPYSRRSLERLYEIPRKTAEAITGAPARPRPPARGPAKPPAR